MTSETRHVDCGCSLSCETADEACAALQQQRWRAIRFWRISHQFSARDRDEPRAPRTLRLMRLCFRHIARPPRVQFHNPYICQRALALSKHCDSQSQTPLPNRRAGRGVWLGLCSCGQDSQPHKTGSHVLPHWRPGVVESGSRTVRTSLFPSRHAAGQVTGPAGRVLLTDCL